MRGLRRVRVLPGRKEEVLTAQAANFTVSSSLTQAAVEAQAKPVEVVPLDDGGPRGTVFNLLIVPLVVTTLLGAQLATLLIEDVPVRRRLGVVGGVAVLSGFAIATLVGPSSARFRACFPCSPPPSR